DATVEVAQYGRRADVRHPGDRGQVMAFGGPAEILELVQAERSMLAVDKDKIEVELSQNVDHPWGGEGKVVAVSLASGTHGGLDSVGLLHRMSSSVRRLRSDCPIPPVFGPLAAAELCSGKSQPSKRRMGNGRDAKVPDPTGLAPKRRGSTQI